jgi:hypothetical protein
VVTALVVARLWLAGLAPGDPVAPYWVTMSAASITVLSAAQVLEVTGAAGLAGFGPVLTDLGLVFWSVATGLIPRWPCSAPPGGGGAWRPAGFAASYG